MDLSRAREETVVLRNKRRTVDVIKEQVDGVLAPGSLFEFAGALSLRGWIAFAEGQTFAQLTVLVARIFLVVPRSTCSAGRSMSSGKTSCLRRGTFRTLSPEGSERAMACYFACFSR